jgi:hypothetical protein
MSNLITVKSRVSSSGAPSALLTGEIAYNHTDDIFYIGKGDDGGGNALTIQEIAGASFAKLASPALSGTPTAPTASAGTNTTQLATTAFVKVAVDAAVAGLDFQSDVLDIQTDATLDPGATPTTGDRYIITASASLHANFGTITGVGDNDIVEYTGSAFEVAYDVSEDGEGALVWDRDSNTWQQYDGSSWSQFGGLGLTGTVGTTDNALVRADGTGGSTAQGSAATLDDSGNLDGVILNGGTY